jgi:hypothetical protein
VLQDFRDEDVDQPVGLLDRQVDGAGPALGFGADVPHLPGRPVLFKHPYDPVSGSICSLQMLDQWSPSGHGSACRAQHVQVVRLPEDHGSFVHRGGLFLEDDTGHVSAILAYHRCAAHPWRA